MTDTPIADCTPLSKGYVSRAGRLAWKWAAPFMGLALVLLFFHCRRPDAFLTATNVKFVAALNC